MHAYGCRCMCLKCSMFPCTMLCRWANDHDQLFVASIGPGEVAAASIRCAVASILRARINPVWDQERGNNLMQFANMSKCNARMTLQHLAMSLSCQVLLLLLLLLLLVGYDDSRIRPWNAGATRPREDGKRCVDVQASIAMCCGCRSCLLHIASCTATGCHTH
jgi:hypothetical protein